MSNIIGGLTFDLRCGSSRDGRLTLEDNDPVGKVGGHDEIVLNDERSLLRMKYESLDNFGSDNTLLGIQEPEPDQNIVEKQGHIQGTYDEGSSIR